MVSNIFIAESTSMKILVKRFALSLLVLFALVSCEYSSDKHVTSPNRTDNKESNIVDKNALIKELKSLKAIFVANDLDKKLDALSFPLPDSVIGVYISNDLQAEYEKNGNLVTKEMFKKHSSDMFVDVNELKSILNNVNIDSLQYTDKIEKLLKKKKQECIERYEIAINGKEVNLMFGFNGFVTEPKEEDYQDGACEYGSFWTFEWDGKKLKLLRHAAAG